MKRFLNKQESKDLFQAKILRKSSKRRVINNQVTKKRFSKTTTFFLSFIAIIVGISIGVAITRPEDTKRAIETATMLQEMITSNLSDNAVAIWAKWNGTIFANLIPWNQTSELSRPGVIVKNELKAYYPIAIIPGFITTHLEVWQSDSCAEDYFGHSIWGDLTMVQFILSNSTCWTKHMSLDPKTGMDPEGIKVRPAEAIQGINYLFPTYWVWAKLIRNLADIGYDSNSIYSATYDWRLPPQNCEKRDSYFSKLKANIENLKKTHGRKVVAITHSMGSNVFYYFLKWVEENDVKWVDENIHAFVNVAGAMLGATKSVSALLSGEMRDSAEIPTNLRAYVADKIISPVERLNMFRTWYSLGLLLPKGGDLIWGDEGHAPDDPEDGESIPAPAEAKTFKHFIQFLDGNHKNLTMDKALDFVWKVMGEEKVGKEIAKNYKTWYSFGASKYSDDILPKGSKYWTNPLKSSLPWAPSMKIYCLYGIEKVTERGYVYRDQSVGDHIFPLEGVRYSLDTTIYNTITLGEGDGTVPLVSLGYMCVEGWQDNPKFNPGFSSVYTREYIHRPMAVLQDMRGGHETADHVDILGNHNMINDILHIVSNSKKADKDNIKSDVVHYSQKITENWKKKS